ncbi:MAG: peptidyl-prolyl cis-trans isomerase [Candidatus Eisenbacteria bacterium]
MLTWLRALGLAALLLAPGCGGGDPVVLTVGPRTVTVSQFEQSFWQAAAHDSTLGPDMAGLQKYADQRVEELLILVLAEKAEPELEYVRQDRLEGYREQLMVEHLRDVEYGDAYDVTDKDLERAYELLGTRRKLRLIQLPSEQEAREVQRALREGAAFARVAEHRSVDERSKASGGELGWLTYTDLPPEDQDEVFTLAPGERTRVLPRGDTFVIYQVDEVEPNQARGTLEEEKPKLEQGIIHRRLLQSRRDYESRLLEQYHYQLNPAQVAWLSVYMREKTANAIRGADAIAQAEERDGMLWSPSQIPWEGMPVAPADTGRVVATFDPPDGRVTPLLVFDQLMTKPIPTWPLFKTTADVEALIRSLVLERLEVREATNRGYGELPEIQYQVQLREDEIRRRQYLRNEYRDPLRPDSLEIEAAYRKRIAEFTTPESRVFVAINVKTEEAARKAARLLRSGMPLDEIKKQFAPADSFFSTPPTGTSPMVEGASPRLDDVLFALRLNEVSEPVPIGNSWTVGQPIRIIPESVQPLDEVRGKIIATIVDQRQEEELAKALAEARKEYPISINQSALAKVRPSKPR